MTVKPPPINLPRPVAPRAPPATIQRATADATFAAHRQIARPSPGVRAQPEELLPSSGGGFQIKSAARQTMSAPSGTFNFVRVHDERPRARPVLVSSKLAHAQLAAGRPVIYAGTARFERGEMTWWSNYSGTYQPIAAFRAQAGLPDDKFVPWQKLQMGGVAMQRGMFTERRATQAEPPVKPEARSTEGAGKAGSATREAAAPSAAPAATHGSGGPARAAAA